MNCAHCYNLKYVEIPGQGGMSEHVTCPHCHGMASIVWPPPQPPDLASAIKALAGQIAEMSKRENAMRRPIDTSRTYGDA